jgi:hypothetical protein
MSRHHGRLFSSLVKSKAFNFLTGSLCIVGYSDKMHRWHGNPIANIFFVDKGCVRPDVPAGVRAADSESIPTINLAMHNSALADVVMGWDYYARSEIGRRCGDMWY